MMLKRTMAAALTLSVMFAAAGCGNSTAPGGGNGGSGGSGQPAVAGDPIRIGYVSALSGDTALWGQAGLNGMLLTAEKINADGGVLGRQIEIVGLDGRGDPQDSVNAYNKLVDENKVVAVVGTNFSSCNIPMASVADQKKVPLIATAASNELVTVDESGKLHPYSFRLCFIDSFQGTKMAEYVLNKGYKTAAIIVNQGDSYSTGVADFTVKAFTAGGGAIVANEAANSGDNDYRAQLTKIVQAKPEALFVPWIYSDVALIAKQAKELGFEGQMVGFDGWDSYELGTMAEGALEGAFFCTRPGFSLPEAKAYGEEYQAKYNIGLEGECLFGNDGLMWIVQCINETGSADPQAIRDALENTTFFKGLIGEMSIDPATHNPVRELAIFEIKGADNVFIEMFK
ncbi:MAG: ABC transporter substrate-binding protein [Peptococcaceae bacterium]|nr:ABC transporter substrate-binding protein [Peptococcaceae bacterium]